MDFAALLPEHLSKNQDSFFCIHPVCVITKCDTNWASIDLLVTGVILAITTTKTLHHM